MTQINSDHQHNSLNADANNFWLASIFGGFVCLLIAGLLVGFLFTGGNKEPEPQVEVVAKTSPVVDKTPVEKNPPVEKKAPVEIKPKEDTTQQPEIKPMVPLPAPKEKVKPELKPKVENNKPELKPATKEPSLLVAPFSKRSAQIRQRSWARHLKSKVTITNSIGMKLTLIPSGEFMMGSTDLEEPDRNDQENQHKVRITKPFYLATKEVTQKQWKSVMDYIPWKGHRRIKEGDDHPAANINWNDAQEFIKKLNQLEGVEYRLPTEAEWEYSCRAGTTSTFHFGISSNGKLSNVKGSFPYGTKIRGTYLGRSAPTGSYAPNNFGLYDMIGNIREWCSDLYDESYYKQFTNKTAIDPQCLNSESTYRVLRGGSWIDFAKHTRSAYRFGYIHTRRDYSYGFRLVRNP